jgi:hypothetical protein
VSPIALATRAPHHEDAVAGNPGRMDLFDREILTGMARLGRAAMMCSEGAQQRWMQRLSGSGLRKSGRS